MQKQAKILLSIISVFSIINLTGCSVPKLAGAEDSIRLASTQQALGCKHIKNQQLSSCDGIGYPAQLRNVKNMMLNDVLTSGGNAYIINELSSGLGRCASADYEVYICPKGYNQASYIRIDTTKDGTITTKDYTKKSVEDRLTKIKKLYKEGILTEEEYKSKRKEIIKNNL